MGLPEGMNPLCPLRTRPPLLIMRLLSSAIAQAYTAGELHRNRRPHD